MRDNNDEDALYLWLTWTAVAAFTVSAGILVALAGDLLGLWVLP